MSTQQLAQQSYTNTQRELASDKSVELRVFTSITSRLRATDTDELGGTIKLFEALGDNVKLWNILLVDLSNPENPFPLDLKTSIIELAEFTQIHTLKIYAGEATHQVLVDINQAMINGLRASLSLEKPIGNSATEAA